MSASRALDFDVAVVGAGPVGCAAALAHARRGARVLVLEAKPKACQRLAGEWLHPRGVAALRELGLDPATLAPYETGRGFAVHPRGDAPVLLPYAGAERGFSGEHASLVEWLRSAVSQQSGIQLELGARATLVTDGELRFQRGAATRESRVRAAVILGADGRRSRVRGALGLADGRATVSRMAGLRLIDAQLPNEGFGHVFLGGPGPMLAYRIAPDALRLCIDVPLGAAAERAWLLAAYAPALPERLRGAFERALRDGEIGWALNQTRARSDYGNARIALLGDAAGFQHPLTAVGMTLGLCDAVSHARSGDFERWRRAREASARVPELLGGALYEAFAGREESALALQRGVFALWRRRPRARARSMRFLAAEDGQLASFVATFVRVAAPAIAGVVARSLLRRDARAARAALDELVQRGSWLIAGAAGRARSSPVALAAPRDPSQRMARSLDATSAIANGVRALVAAQRDDGSWEGEVRWCPMLAAQYVLFAHRLGLELSAERRARLLRQFEATQRADGLWGLHALSPPYLFVSALVYVAARLLGEPAGGALLARAREFIAREDIVAIPSWGKFWLALFGLYDWRGVPPTVPELWALPRALPIHPSRFYCHTRHIYLAMSALYARRTKAPDSPRLREIRSELYPRGMESVDWTRARGRLRSAELVTPPSRALRAVYRLLAAFERFHAPALRRRILRELDERMRFELRSTDFTCLSPVSGLLSILALHAADPEDADAQRAIERLDAWMWNDAEDGLRIAGARSATWDTSFALQALSHAAPFTNPGEALARGAEFLRRQQIHQTPGGWRSAFRLDPRGGFCFAGAWHGWPVSDCTAEAMDALARAGGAAWDRNADLAALRFLLRCQNADGGFGSYEARRTRVGLEWLNPAEMFGESMTEHSYVECTASCLAALADFRRRHPREVEREVGRAIARAKRRLRRLQRRDGSWRGVWGVQFVYGTLFGIRGLMAAGATPGEPAVRRACEWLLARQRRDGGWGEDAIGCVRAEYVEHAQSQVLHTAWALLALLEAEDPNDEAIARAAKSLIDSQREDGSWPRQDPAGLFFRTALLDYELYRGYFPLWALARYEQRRRGRARAEQAA
ncbi:MAG TPA: FAD-dependent monooxygenase [Myxococcota bacterium]|nr:FAD-dependent monooxygenase [Myxococcota bacterium]